MRPKQSITPVEIAKICTFNILQIKNSVLNLVLIGWNLDNSIENVVNFYNQSEFWKKGQVILEQPMFWETQFSVTLASHF